MKKLSNQSSSPTTLATFQVPFSCLRSTTTSVVVTVRIPSPPRIGVSVLSTLAIFECPVTTNSYLWIDNLLIDSPRLEALPEIGADFVAAPDAAAIALNNDHVVGHQGGQSVSVGIADRGQPSFPQGDDFEDG